MWTICASKVSAPTFLACMTKLPVRFLGHLLEVQSAKGARPTRSAIAVRMPCHRVPGIRAQPHVARTVRRCAVCACQWTAAPMDRCRLAQAASASLTPSFTSGLTPNESKHPSWPGPGLAPTRYGLLKAMEFGPTATANGEPTLGVSAPLAASMAYTETVFEPPLVTKRNFPRLSTASESGPVPAA